MNRTRLCLVLRKRSIVRDRRSGTGCATRLSCWRPWLSAENSHDSFINPLWLLPWLHTIELSPLPSGTP
ncbi:hypothetical protein M406DRAFT_355152 [Cryphonectria parasitica EP155]|uniref:Uncharacterized protein n=1 Tax=Cryphonectria parasitica (strain ATCC 38755 / EP155) TaxID=660469 RepID=A0A9P4Y949_CRYP1|nr:uncharacterized protein M406DRAFT_355152 [Cryphonectria parasitica EP155]KAF3769078.1 hypothetical protein M406DRAFT_355152 [Cryphonectria parasitica EP155]